MSNIVSENIAVENDDIQIEKVYWNNGFLKQKTYHVGGGNYHRLDGPAYEAYSINGTIEFSSWWYNGIRHRLDGPAIEEFDEFGKRVSAEYYLNGWLLSKKEHQRQVALLKLTTQAQSIGDESVSL